MSLDLCTLGLITQELNIRKRRLVDILLLPPANEVWGKVICLQVCVCPRGGVCMVPGGAWSLGGSMVPEGCMVLGEGMHGPGGCMVPGGAWSWGGAW